MGTIGEIEGSARCLGFGSTADLWPFLVLEDAGTPLASFLRQSSGIAARPLAKQLLSILGSLPPPHRARELPLLLRGFASHFATLLGLDAIGAAVTVAIAPDRASPCPGPQPQRPPPGQERCAQPNPGRFRPRR